MLSNAWDQGPVNHRAGNAPALSKRTQHQQQEDKGWRQEGCGSNDALLKPPPDSATRFLQAVSLRLTTHSVKSQMNSIRKATPSNRNGNVQSTVFNKTGRAFHTGTDQTTPSSETGRGFTPRSLGKVPFVGRGQSGSHNATVENTKMAEGVRGSGNKQGARLTPGKDENDFGSRKNSIFQRIGSLRIRKRTSIEYKSIDDGNRPLAVSTNRSSLRHKLRSDVRLPARRAEEFDSCVSYETVGPPGTLRDTRGSASDGEEDEGEDARSSRIHWKRSFPFQRSSAIWRSFTSKSRTRSNDVLSETTERENDIGWQREELELELKLLNDSQQHRALIGSYGERNSFLNLLTHNRRHFGFSKDETNGVCISSISSNPPKQQELCLKDAERYRHVLDCLYRFNIAHAHSTEAAFVLCEHAQLCTSAFDESRFPKEDDGKWRRGEQLLLRALEEFDLGKTWEYAIDVCERLCKIYKAKFMYAELSKLLQKQANLYRKILQEPRAQPCSYMVQFVGKEFPDFLRNKGFVLRTERLENEFEVSGIISDEFKGALRLDDNMDPHETVTTDIGRGFKLFKLKPVPSLSDLSIAGSRKVPDAVQFFHRYYNVSSFEVVSFSEHDPKTIVNIDSSLPTISRWAQVKTIS